MGTGVATPTARSGGRCGCHTGDRTGARDGSVKRCEPTVRRGCDRRTGDLSFPAHRPDPAGCARRSEPAHRPCSGRRRGAAGGHRGPHRAGRRPRAAGRSDGRHGSTVAGCQGGAASGAPPVPDGPGRAHRQSATTRGRRRLPRVPVRRREGPPRPARPRRVVRRRITSGGGPPERVRHVRGGAWSGPVRSTGRSSPT